MKKRTPNCVELLREDPERGCSQKMEVESHISIFNHTKRFAPITGTWLKWLSVLAIFMSTLICTSADSLAKPTGISCGLFWNLETAQAYHNGESSVSLLTMESILIGS